MNKCKRMTVYAFAEGVRVRNGNEAACKNIVGGCGCTHAEIRLLQLVPNPASVHVTHSPCLNCAKALVRADVKIVTYDEAYRLTDGIDYLREHGVMVYQLQGGEEHA